MTIQTFVGKVITLLSNTLSRFVAAILPRRKQHLLILWLQSLITVILEPKKMVASIHDFATQQHESDIVLGTIFKMIVHTVK